MVFPVTLRFLQDVDRIYKKGSSWYKFKNYILPNRESSKEYVSSHTAIVSIERTHDPVTRILL